MPEVASRRHLELTAPVVREALEGAGATLGDVDAIAVTTGPGADRRPPRRPLGGEGARLVAPAAARPGRPSARPRRLPLARRPTQLEPPFLCLLASGGHTLLLDVQERSGYRVIGTTLDDAAGEAFDKGARLLGLGYPGGAAIDRLAREGDPDAHDFPVARVPGLDFSFSGLKTALLYAVRDLPPAELERRRADLAASYQRAIVRALVERSARPRRRRPARGVSPSSAAWRRTPSCAPGSMRSARVAAPLSLCTDNAAMIASAARYATAIPFPDYLELDAYASAT